MEDPMLKQFSIVALALGALPSLADAQQRVAVDQYGRPVNQPTYQMPAQTMPAQPGMQSQGVPMAQPMPAQAQAPMQGQSGPMMNNAYPSQAQAMAPADNGSPMKDEYGNLYNSRGDRIDRSGRILPPPVTPPGARALR
jgi:hypothetical protein